MKKSSVLSALGAIAGIIVIVFSLTTASIGIHVCHIDGLGIYPMITIISCAIISFIFGGFLLLTAYQNRRDDLDELFDNEL